MTFKNGGDYAADEKRPSVVNGKVPEQGWNTNKDIGGVPDWQNVGRDTEKDNIDPYIIDGGSPQEAFVGNHDTVVRGTTGGANISKPPLDAEQSYHVKPEYGGSTLGQGRTAEAELNPKTYPEGQGPNLSAKYKYPNVHQDTSLLPPDGGRPRNI